MTQTRTTSIRLTDYDLHLFNQGTHTRAYEKLGAHPTVGDDGRAGTYFAVWAPNAERVSVIGDFNAWRRDSHPMSARDGSGIWEAFIPDVGPGALYKYAIDSRFDGFTTEKADPYGFAGELRPQTASRVVDLEAHVWADQRWMEHRHGNNALSAPMSIYEVHLGSWRRHPGSPGFLSYAELAAELVPYVTELGFTHVELMPIAEHPFDGSWGYQTTGYFAPTSRFGAPQDFMALVDALHRAGVGVILDWVPGHFPSDAHGLAYFDGTHLYEHADPKKGVHRDWNTYIFNYDRREVASFLISNALFWLDKYHLDGLRVDAVASMLYLDYSREEGDWIPNVYGGRDNLEAIAFLRRVNECVYGAFPDVITFAEESTSWPMVSRPTTIGGLGFGAKWDMGWMHDTLEYFALDPIHRKHHHHRLTFRMLYFGSENFTLPLSHDEVVYGKGSLLGKMPGDEWQRFANLRLLYGTMFTQPGKKLLFMGGELAQYTEWNHDRGLDWNLLDYPLHRGVQRWLRDLNTTYRAEPSLHVLDCDPAGFRWIDCNDPERSVLSYLRIGTRAGDRAERHAAPTGEGGERDEVDHPPILVACNYTPVPRTNHRIGVPRTGLWREILNSDASLYGGGGMGNMGRVETVPVACNGYPSSLVVTLPPLAMVAFRWEPAEGPTDDVAGAEPPATPAKPDADAPA